MIFLPLLFFCSFSYYSLPPSSITLLFHYNYVYGSSQERDSQKQTAVVLLTSNGKTCQSSGGISVATFCADALPTCKHTKQRDWLSLIRPSSNVRPNGSLRFSLSLNDVGQRVDNLCRGLHFIDRTCSEGELELKPDAAPPPGSDSRTVDSKLAAPASPQDSNPAFPARTYPPLVHSFTNNYKYTLGIPSTDSLPPNPTVTHPSPPFNNHFQPHPSSGTNYLHFLLPFPPSSTSTSLQCSELGSYASHLHITKSSSALEGSESGFPPEELLGDDDVFEDEQPKPVSKGPGRLAAVTAAGPGSPPAPLCYMDEDSDLDCCPSPLSEKTGLPSPFSLSGDCCRWVPVWMVQSTPVFPVTW
ncbi:uncharacterized protein [Antennarius striatus]|uniref:uncharacterized protein n=1 Tax=Antennarius striatus TaxID=241820 RepID=UPI0035AFD1E7